MKLKILALILISVVVFVVINIACKNSDNSGAGLNEKMRISDNNITEEKKTTPNDTSKRNGDTKKNAIVKENSTYNCDIEADKAKYDGHVDFIVSDNCYATQINDWYLNYDMYDGKVVQIEGYYIGEFQPYDFVGRYGPKCPCCNGGYVSFEFLSNEDLTKYKSEKDWIRVTGILREDKDNKNTTFHYIEALKVEKMDKVGKDTITN